MKNAIASRQQTTTSPMTARCEKKFLDFLYRKLGLVIKKHQLKRLHDSIELGCQKFGYASWQEYIDALEQDTNVAAAMEHLIASVTIGESYFFRDREQITYLRNTWLPQIIANKRQQGDKSLRIWSAGCSNGQELYSLAIMISEALPDLHDWNIHLLGTDINVNVLSNALRGEYQAWSFRATPDTIKQRYFSNKGNQFIIKEPLRQMAKFTYLNLADDKYPSMLSQTNAIDLILCRNVFIYFDQAVVDNIVDRFSRSLVSEGVLMLGASDLSASDTGNLKLKQHGNILCFHKCSRQQQKKARRPAKKQPSTPIAADNTKTKSTIRPVKHKTGKQPLDHLLHDMLRDGQWDDALKTIETMIKEQGKTASLLQHKSKVLANLGQLKRARALCDESLAIDPIDKHSYFLRAMIFNETGDHQAAETDLRKTIYLDPRFSEAHFQLGILLISRGKEEYGKRSLHNALELAKESPPEDKLHQASGMNFQRFVEILEREMEIYDGSSQERSDARA